MNISLRDRIILWYAIATPLLIFLLAFAAQQTMVLALQESMEDSLQRRADTIISAITSGLGSSQENYNDVLERLAEQDFQSIPLLLRVANPRGQVVAEFGEIPDPLILALDSLLRLPATDEGRFDTIDVRGVEALRVITVNVNHPSTGEVIVIVQAAESLSSITTARKQLWQWSLLVSVVGSAITVVGGLILLRRGFRPLDRILMRVKEVESSDLKTGLPDESRPPELQQLADNLNNMWERLHSAFNAKQMFVASVSHEIRTPLTALEGQIDVLLMQPSLDPEVRHSLMRMSNEVRRLVRMANNLLLNAQLETKPAFATEIFDLGNLVDEIIGEVWVLAENIELKLLAQDNVMVAGDRDLLKQLILNVLENAIKYTQRGGAVEIKLTQERDWVIIEVTDTGVGIPHQHLPYVMDPFYKGDTSRRNAGRGAGLGLAIVKQIVELHSGEIEIRSQEGNGTSVKVRIPNVPFDDMDDSELGDGDIMAGRQTMPSRFAE